MILKYLWLFNIFILEILAWLGAIKGFKEDYNEFSCENDNKIKRILDTFKYNIGLTILIIIHFFIISFCSFLYFLID